MSTVRHSFTVTLTEPAPPSVNHLYVSGYRGRRVLSAEGVAFKCALTSAVAEECLTLPWRDAIDVVYLEAGWVRLTIGLHVKLFNNSWKPGARTPKGALQSPYRTLDGSNYIKAIEDAVVAGTGIDDSAHLSTTILKLDADTPYLEIGYEVMSRSTRHDD